MRLKHRDLRVALPETATSEVTPRCPPDSEPTPRQMPCAGQLITCAGLMCHAAPGIEAAIEPRTTRLVQQNASAVLALCDVRTLYLRNVPDDVVDRLERLAARDAMSVSALAVRELAAISRRADNPALLASLPDLGIDATLIVSEVQAGRASP